ncbi:hypothetical protein ABCR94_13615 [Streptomyces sp. 21So2-11]|uniref:hypothetical protein n=1 Tax=Streptomyces sp. 21So2-11 TaxID=3144408 RepID=UPI00321B7BEE
MATSESAATTGATSGALGSSVPRATAVAVLAEEPTSGLFPEKSAEAEAEGAKSPKPTVSSSSPSTGEATAPVASPPAASATTATTTAVPATTASAAEEEESAESTAGTTASASSASTTTTAAATATAATATATASPRRTVGLPLGRPGKPMIAAAVAGGLILVGVPFLISGLSGSDDQTIPTSAQGPGGSRMGPDGSGPGLVPGQQNAPGENIPKPGGGGANAKRNTGQAGGVHEGGSATGKEVMAKTGSTAGLGTGKDGKTVPAQKNGVPANPGVPADKSPADKPAGNQNRQAAPVTFQHLIGPGCDTAGFATSEQYRDGSNGWRGSRGSMQSNGCSGFYYSVPLSDSTSKSNGFAQWKFYTGSVTKGSCKVSVYIPNVKDIGYVGGNPARYTVHRAFVPKSSTEIGTFEINQPAHLGQWVSAGTFPASTGKVSVVLDNRGKTSGNRHAAAAPVKVDCTAA